MKNLKTIVATALAAGALIGGTALAADSLNFGDLYRNETTCSEANNIDVEYKSIIPYDSVFFGTPQDSFWFLIGAEKDSDDKIVFYLGRGAEADYPITNFFEIYDIKGTLKCMEVEPAYHSITDESYEKMKDKDRLYFYLGVYLANSDTEILGEFPNPKCLFYIEVNELTKVGSLLDGSQ